jgi:hypothetical protein
MVLKQESFQLLLPLCVSMRISFLSSARSFQKMGFNFFVLRAFVKKVLHLCANRIKLSVFHGVRVFDPPFPQTFQQNC